MTARPTPATVELLERLVAIDSTSATASNVPTIDACEEVLRSAGAWTRRVDGPRHEWPGGHLPKQGLLARVGPGR